MIDCDVHNSWRSAEELLPYMDPFFRDYLTRGELPGGVGSLTHRAPSAPFTRTAEFEAPGIGRASSGLNMVTAKVGGIGSVGGVAMVSGCIARGFARWGRS